MKAQVVQVRISASLVAIIWAQFAIAQWQVNMQSGAPNASADGDGRIDPQVDKELNGNNTSVVRRPYQIELLPSERRMAIEMVGGDVDESGGVGLEPGSEIDLE